MSPLAGVAASFGRRRYQLMGSMRNVGTAKENAGSHVQRRVRPREKRGYLEKLRGAHLADSACSYPAQHTWRRRFVVVEGTCCCSKTRVIPDFFVDAKCIYYQSEADADPLATIPLYLCSAIRTHPEFGEAAFGLRCGHFAQVLTVSCISIPFQTFFQFVFRAESAAEMGEWLFVLQQWLAKLKLGNEPLVHSILAVPRCMRSWIDSALLSFFCQGGRSCAPSSPLKRTRNKLRRVRRRLVSPQHLTACFGRKC